MYFFHCSGNMLFSRLEFLAIHFVFASALNFSFSEALPELPRLLLPNTSETTPGLLNSTDSPECLFLSPTQSNASSLLDRGIRFECIPCIPIGHNQDAESCADAVQNMAIVPGPATEIFTWARRDSRVPFQIPLPQKIISCKECPSVESSCI